MVWDCGVDAAVGAGFEYGVFADDGGGVGVVGWGVGGWEEEEAG